MLSTEAKRWLGAAAQIAIIALMLLGAVIRIEGRIARLEGQVEFLQQVVLKQVPPGRK